MLVQFIREGRCWCSEGMTQVGSMMIVEFKSLDDIMVAILCALNLLFGIVNVV